MQDNCHSLARKRGCVTFYLRCGKVDIGTLWCLRARACWNHAILGTQGGRPWISIKLWARNGEVVRQAIELGEIAHIETASVQLPGNLSRKGFVPIRG